MSTWSYILSSFKVLGQFLVSGFFCLFFSFKVGIIPPRVAVYSSKHTKNMLFIGIQGLPEVTSEVVVLAIPQK